LIGELGQDKPYFVIAKQKGDIVGALPLYFFRSKCGNLLTTMAWHTISGIACLKEADHVVVTKTLLEYSLNLASELDCIALSINTNPFSNDGKPCINYCKPDYTMENFLQYIDLKEIFDKRGIMTHPNYCRRTNLSRNIAKACEKEIAISEEQTKSNVDGYFRIYDKRMKELHTTPLPKRFFTAALENLVMKEKGKFIFAFYNERIVAGCMLLMSKKMINVFSLSMDSDFKNLRSNFLLIRHVLKYAYRHGVQIINWMSSPRRGDGVYRWKEQWGSHEKAFLYLTKTLADISHWKDMSWTKMAEAYNLHFVVPFNLLKNVNLQITSKDELTSFMQSSCSKD
jgi:hypothetical protein